MNSVAFRVSKDVPHEHPDHHRLSHPRFGRHNHPSFAVRRADQGRTNLLLTRPAKRPLGAPEHSNTISPATLAFFALSRWVLAIIIFLNSGGSDETGPILAVWLCLADKWVPTNHFGLCRHSCTIFPNLGGGDDVTLRDRTRILSLQIYKHVEKILSPMVRRFVAERELQMMRTFIISATARSAGPFRSLYLDRQGAVARRIGGKDINRWRSAPGNRHDEATLCESECNIVFSGCTNLKSVIARHRTLLRLHQWALVKKTLS